FSPSTQAVFEGGQRTSSFAPSVFENLGVRDDGSGTVRLPVSGPVSVGRVGVMRGTRSSRSSEAVGALGDASVKLGSACASRWPLVAVDDGA
ncbi:MAG: hypothetical protein AAFR23_11105, partial [Pseudomonadota bacterium]